MSQALRAVGAVSTPDYALVNAQMLCAKGIEISNFIVMLFRSRHGGVCKQALPVALPLFSNCLIAS